MHLKTSLILALLLVAGGLFWWWVYDGGWVAVIVVAVLGVGLFLALRGNSAVKDQLDAQGREKNGGNDRPS